ncbi:MAG: hypothetical protein ABII27_01740 [bacterium]
MLVLVTLLYVVLTYFILNTTRQQFNISRLPFIQVSDDGFEFSFKNKSNYPVKQLRAQIKIIYPLPKTIWEKLCSRLKSQTARLEYVITEIKSHGSEVIDVSEGIIEKKLLPLTMNKKKYDIDELDYFAEHDIYFNIVLSYVYESDMGYPSDNIKQVYKLAMSEGDTYPRYAEYPYFRVKRIK